MPGLLPHVDPDGLLEFSVVYTDRALNHMSQRFVGVMQDIIAGMREAYGAHSVAIVPGGGTYGMEAVARQLAHDRKVMVLRNGWFSFRWTQILDTGRIAQDVLVAKARPADGSAQAPWSPAPLEEVLATIRAEQPAVVFAPHVETASGIMLPDDYIRQVAEAVHAHGGLMVLDCIASGAIWVDMQATGVDVLITAPQKGWSGTPCAAMIGLSERARQAVEASTSSSFACDLKKWTQITEGYEKGAAAYHATMPTDALVTLRDVMQEARSQGLEQLRQQQLELGREVRALLESRGFPSVAAEGFQAPGVVVSYTTDPDIQNGSKFRAQGLLVAAGVPLQCDEPDSFRTFRLGLFGLEKCRNIGRTVSQLRDALDRIQG